MTARRSKRSGSGACLSAREVVVVLGGGAAGYFAAIRAAELAGPAARVLLLEATATPLQKVRISGGGRCNVTNATTDPAVLATKYPRGAKELRGVLSKFGPRETMQWFESRGVALKAEPDGRVFPTTDDSETICACLEREAARVGVEVRTGATVARVERVARPFPDQALPTPVPPPAFRLRLKDGSTLDAAAFCIATGSNPHGLALARALGHEVVPGVPSLFTFDVRDPRLDGLAGVSVERVRAKAIVGDETFEQEGPLLVTHWGLSAHAVLRLSAWGARAFHAAGYRARLVVDLAPDVPEPQLRARLDAMRRERPAAAVAAHPVVDVPRRLWERLCEAALAESTPRRPTRLGADEPPGRGGGSTSAGATARWGELSSRATQALLDQVKRATFDVTGKGPFREEFVTAGGVSRKEVDWRTMESKLAPGLYFAGEALDVDALTGGFNLQNAWSTGWLAGSAMAARVAPRIGT